MQLHYKKLFKYSLGIRRMSEPKELLVLPVYYLAGLYERWISNVIQSRFSRAVSAIVPPAVTFTAQRRPINACFVYFIRNFCMIVPPAVTLAV